MVTHRKRRTFSELTVFSPVKLMDGSRKQSSQWLKTYSRCTKALNLNNSSNRRSDSQFEGVQFSRIIKTIGKTYPVRKLRARSAKGRIVN
ncbi:unnamed protein product [Lactuca virosa]|uniref:Ribosomal protein L34 n=1 Tax=Lactuca virosa TaxID=75947 RepID=A0AAU9PEQ5_9ASTR|nr:unnamed protein product [Lactuca virosa]